MRDQFRIESNSSDEKSRCSLRPLTAAAQQLVGTPGSGLAEMRDQFGICSVGACHRCVRAKCDASSPVRIEAGDTVETRMGWRLSVKGFEETLAGFRTGFVNLYNGVGRTFRLPLSDIILHRKASA